MADDRAYRVVFGWDSEKQSFFARVPELDIYVTSATRAEALAEVDQLPGELAPMKSGVLRSIASIQAQAGDVDGALDWIGKLDAPKLRREAVLGLAEGLAERIAETKPVPATEPTGRDQPEPRPPDNAP